MSDKLQRIHRMDGEEQLWRDIGGGAHAPVIAVGGIAIPTGAPVVGQKAIAVTGTAVALAASATPLPTASVLVSALTDNAAAITVGGSGVTNTVDGSGNGYILEAGQSVIVMADDLADVYVNGTAGDIATFSAG